MFFPYHPENESPQIDSNQGLIPEEESNEVIETHNQQKEENKMIETTPIENNEQKNQDKAKYVIIAASLKSIQLEML